MTERTILEKLRERSRRASVGSMRRELAELRAVLASDFCEDSPAARRLWDLAIEAALQAANKFCPAGGDVMTAVRALKKN